MNKSTSYDIVLRTDADSEKIQSLLIQLAEINHKDICNIIIWDEYKQEKKLEKWVNIFHSFSVINSGNVKLSELVQNDLIVLDGKLVLVANWISDLSEFAYKTLETGMASPIISNSRENFEMMGVDLKRIRLSKRLWIDSCKGHCILIKKNVVMSLGSYVLQDLYLSGWKTKLNKIILQLGYKSELCDSLLLYSDDLSNQYESDYGYPEVFDNIKLHKSLISKKRKLLYVIQADFSGDASNNIGGTQLHVKDLVYGVKEDLQVFVAARDGEFLRVTAYLDDRKQIFKFHIGPPTQMPVFYEENQRQLFKTILNAFSIDLVHVHHTYSFSMEIYEEAARLNIPTIATLHDFYFLCPTIKMFDNKNTCCIDDNNKERCRECLGQLMGIEDDLDYISHWRKKMLDILQRCQKVIVPSESAKIIFSQYFPDIIERIQVVEHGYDAVVHKDISIELTTDAHENIEIINQDGQCTEVQGWAYYEGINNNAGKIYLEINDSDKNMMRIPTYKMERSDVAKGNCLNLKTGFQAFLPNNGLEMKNMRIRVIISWEGKEFSSGKYYEINQVVTKNHDNLRVAFIGGLSIAKGSRQIHEIIQKNLMDIDWYIFGGIDDERLAKTKKKNLTWTNFYQREDLPLYLSLHKIDLVVILSLWPETFCYTLSEAIAYKKAVIVTNVGALGDRTNLMKCGWIVSLDRIVQDVTSILERIKSRPLEYEGIVQNVENTELRSLDLMNKDYLKIYNEINVDNRIREEFDTDLIYFSWQDRLPDDGKLVRIISNDEYQSYIMKLEHDMQQLCLSRSYKLAKKISVFWSGLKGIRR